MKHGKYILLIVFVFLLLNSGVSLDKPVKLCTGSPISQVYIPRSEHPRPSFVRENWLCLNGQWRFKVDPEDKGLSEEWHHEGKVSQKWILVPFPWQSKLAFNESGEYSDLVGYSGVAWYQRSFDIPAEWENKWVVLNFEGVDYHAMVWVNDDYVGEHSGGYTSFSFNITKNINFRASNTLTVRVYDPADTSEIPCGKQKSTFNPVWENVKFTPSSGIWKPVWLEAISQTHISNIHVVPDVDASTVNFNINTSSFLPSILTLKIFNPTNEMVESEDISLSVGETTTNTSIVIENAMLWSPEHPYLYNVSITLKDSSGVLDEVWTYFGMRKISVSKGQILLNNKPIYLMGALIQGYNPLGLYTFPTDTYAKRDIELSKDLGFNLLRMHIKIEDSRFYYWADKLGMLIWQDIPNIERFTEKARDNFEEELIQIIPQLWSHPSIIIWCVFNEEWGLSEGRMSDEIAVSAEVRDFVMKMTNLVRQKDPNRLIVDNSPAWFQTHSHMDTDICDYHPYSGNSIANWRGMLSEIIENTYNGSTFGFAHDCCYSGQPIVLSECGTGGIRGFRWTINELRKHKEIVGYVYTEIYDVEHELAGILTYDRTLKSSVFNVTEINSLDYLAVDSEYLPETTTNPAMAAQNEFKKIDVYFSHYGSEGENGYLFWRLEGTEEEGRLPIKFTPYSVNVYTLSFIAPQVLGQRNLSIWVEDENGVLAGKIANIVFIIHLSFINFIYVVAILLAIYIGYHFFIKARKGQEPLTLEK